MRIINIFILLAFLLVLCATPVDAVPALPHAFYGIVEINNRPAPNGSRVSATVEGGTVIPTQNPVATAGSSYGVGSPRLLVQGDITPGATVTFYVNGVEAEGVTAVFEAGGGPTERNLSVAIAAPLAGGVGGVPPNYIGTNLCGATGKFQIDNNGKVLQTVTCGCKDSPLSITIPKGTLALDHNGDPLSSLTITEFTTPPPPPEGTNIIGIPFNLGPAGATFDPPVTFTWTFDPKDLPEGVDPGDLVLAYYDEKAGEWVELDCTVDTQNNTITAQVGHFTTFAIIGRVKTAAFTLSSLAISPTEVTPGEKVNIGVSVANTGDVEGSYAVVLKIGGVKEAEKVITLAAGLTQTVNFSVTRKEAGDCAVALDGLSGSFCVVAPAPKPAPAPAPPAPAPVPAPAPAPAPAPGPLISWPIVFIAMGGMVVVVLLIIFVPRCRRKY